MKRLSMMVLTLFFAAGMCFSQSILSAYTTLEDPLAKALFEQFEKDTSIRVNFVRLSGGEVVTRVEAEAANPQASIWIGGVGLDHIIAKNKNLTVPYQSRFAAGTRPEFKDTQNYWIGLYTGPVTFVTNLDRARTLGFAPPRSWAELLKPEYQGHIRMADPTISGTAYNVITTIRTLNNGDENAVFDYLKKLDLNIDQYAPSGSAPSKSVAAGEVPIAIGYAHDQIKLKIEGANVEINAPGEGTGFELASMSLIRGGKQQIEARRLYDWILSSKNARKIFIQWYVLLVANGAERHPDAFSMDQLKIVRQDTDWEGNPENRKRLLDRWTAEIGSKR